MLTATTGHRPDNGSPSGAGTTGGAGATGGAILDGGATTRDRGLDGGVLSTTGLPTRPEPGSGPGDVLGAVIGNIAAGVGPAVQPAAVAAVASTFGFPLALMLAVILFLVVQSRLDGRDPKLRAAPLTASETYLPFADEVGR